MTRPTRYFSSTSGYFMFPGRWRYLRIPLIVLGVTLAAYGYDDPRLLVMGLALALSPLPSFVEPSPEGVRRRSRSLRAKETVEDKAEADAKAEASPRQRVVERRPAQTCVFCHDELAGAEAALSCQGCGSTYHPACFAELGRCAALGCGPAHQRAQSPLKEAS